MAEHAIEVSLNGQRLVRCGVGRPGSLSATVTVMWRDGEARLGLGLHGATNAPYHTSLDWKRSRVKLRVGDRVRIRVVEPEQLDAPTIRPRWDRAPPVTRAELRRELARLARSAKRDEREGPRRLAERLEYEALRPPPRRYPRSSMVR